MVSNQGQDVMNREVKGPYLTRGVSQSSGACLRVKEGILQLQGSSASRNGKLAVPVTSPLWSHLLCSRCKGGHRATL